jgi:hypothetical protein
VASARSDQINGLHILTSEVTAHSLVINRWSRSGIWIEGNYIGMNESQAPYGNAGHGVYLGGYVCDTMVGEHPVAGRNIRSADPRKGSALWVRPGAAGRQIPGDVCREGDRRICRYC